MNNTFVTIPYEDFVKLQSDSADKNAVVSLLKTEFPDDTCMVIAIKSVLGVVENEEEESTEDVEESPEP